MAMTELDPTMRSGGLGTELVGDGLPCRASIASSGRI